MIILIYMLLLNLVKKCILNFYLVYILLSEFLIEKKKLFFSKSNEAKFYLKYIDKIDFYKAIGFVKKYNYLIYKNIRYINTPFLISYLNYETYYLHPLVSR